MVRNPPRRWYPERRKTKPPPVAASSIRGMKHTIILILLCIVLPLAALGQSATMATIIGMGYVYPEPVPVAPGQVVTLFVSGLGVSATTTVTVQQGSSFTAPILNTGAVIINCPLEPVGSNGCTYTGPLTVQIPFEISQPCPAPNVCSDVLVPTEIYVNVNGTPESFYVVTPQFDRVHILTACDAAAGGNGIGSLNGWPCPPMVTHADGSAVTAPSPAQGGEELVLYAVGLGPTTTLVPTGTAPTTAVPTQETFQLDFNFAPNVVAALPIPPSMNVLVSKYAVPLFSGLVPGYVGLYQINFVVPPPPAGTVTCGGAIRSNLTVSVGGSFSFDGAGICVAPAE
jgi:uncharacterized protein (TIGR03437 family)